MKHIVLFLLCGICSTLWASPIRGKLGANGMENVPAPEAWTNPYISEGLVAMWDGVWNAGGGKHKTTTTGWTDLVNGLVLASERNLAFSQDSLLHGKYAISVESPILADVASDTFTFTIVFSRNTIPDGDATDELIFMPTVSGRVWYQRIARIYAHNGIMPSWGICRGTYDGIENKLEKYMRCAVNTKYSYTFVFGLGFFRAYAGDTLVFEVYRTAFNMTDGNGWFYTGNTKTDGNDYNIRFYNRALTAEEITHNYLVDKERFGVN